jgi:hypothetical protein
MKKKLGLPKVTKSKGKKVQENLSLLSSASSSVVALPKILKRQDGVESEKSNSDLTKPKKTLRFKDDDDDDDEEDEEAGANMSTGDEDDDNALKKQQQEHVKTQKKNRYKKKLVTKKPKDKNELSKQVIEIKSNQDVREQSPPRIKSAVSQMRLLEERGALKFDNDTNHSIMPDYIRDIQVLPPADILNDEKVKPREARIYEIPSGLTMNFFELLSRAKWQQAKSVCVTCKFLTLKLFFTLRKNLRALYFD